VKKILVIDDLADRSLDCNLLLDQNFYLDPNKRYESVVCKASECLLGPKYAILRDEFIKNVKTIDSRTRTSLKRIFVFMGGADSSNETKKVLLALDQVKGSNIVADIIVGAVNPRAAEIREMCKHREYTVFHQDVQNIAAAGTPSPGSRRFPPEDRGTFAQPSGRPATAPSA